MDTFLERAIRDGHAILNGEGKKEKITYVAVDHSERYSDPEEKLRAICAKKPSGFGTM